MMATRDVVRATKPSDVLLAQLLLCEPIPSAIASISEITPCKLDVEPFSIGCPT
jgi:hypothetical protein